MIDPEWLKVTSDMAGGKKKARTIFYVFICLALFLVLLLIVSQLRPAIESLDWASNRFAGEQFEFRAAWQSLTSIVFVFLLLASMAAAFGIALSAVGAGLGFLLGPTHLRSEVNEFASKVINGISQSNVAQDPQMEELVKIATELKGRSPNIRLTRAREGIKAVWTKQRR